MDKYYKVQKLKHDQSPVNGNVISYTSKGLAANANSVSNSDVPSLVQDFLWKRQFDDHGFFDDPMPPVEDGALIGYEKNPVIPAISPHSTGGDGTRFMDQLPDKKNSNINHSPTPIEVNYSCMSSAVGGDIENDASTTTKSYDKGAWRNITWGSYDQAMEALMSSASSYELLYCPGANLKPRRMHRKEKMEKLNIYATQKVKTNRVKKSARKEPLEGFPSNVKTLTGTGIFDEVMVLYVSTSGEELPAFISGPGYFCGCNSCNFSKLVNADEFERHAGFKTSHPNNNIRFMNGRSMHQVVQELKATPRAQLFDAILMVTGSSINEKAFKAWKESFQGLDMENSQRQ